jgi:hypothetical protein
MAKYLFVYHGGSRPETKDAQAKVMAAWGEWFGSMGKAVINGGNPVGKSWTIKSNGSVAKDGGANPVSGYSLIEPRRRAVRCSHRAVPSRSPKRWTCKVWRPPRAHVARGRCVGGILSR